MEEKVRESTWLNFLRSRYLYGVKSKWLIPILLFASATIVNSQELNEQVVKQSLANYDVEFMKMNGSINIVLDEKKWFQNNEKSRLSSIQNLVISLGVIFDKKNTTIELDGYQANNGIFMKNMKTSLINCNHLKTLLNKEGFYLSKINIKNKGSNDFNCFKNKKCNGIIILKIIEK